MNGFKLSELDAHFVRLTDEGFEYTDNIDRAQGLWFQCPKCVAEKNSAAGAHRVLCFFKDRGVPDDHQPGPGRWNPSGTGISDLTFVPPGAVSVLLTAPGCGWHGFIRNGEATLS